MRYEEYKIKEKTDFKTNKITGELDIIKIKPHISVDLENIKKEVDNNNIDVILNVKNFSKTMYYKMIGTSIMKILKAEYSEVLENINKNDK